MTKEQINRSLSNILTKARIQNGEEISKITVALSISAKTLVAIELFPAEVPTYLLFKLIKYYGGETLRDACIALMIIQFLSSQSHVSKSTQ